jgi:2-polyprenyl-3-methyl-5-hydroxy-6-metoxy-1,4-benzoquinol methylase
MSQRFKAAKNTNDSKNTRLDIAGEFSKYRFGRDQLAHVSRYLFIVEQMIDYAKRLGRPLRVLDIGCGDVYIARVLVSSFVVKKRDVVALYTGFDIDDKILSRASGNLPQSLDIELVCGDVTDGDLAQFDTDAYDLVICTEVIEHIKPEFVAAFLGEIKRIGVRAIISTPNFAGGTGKIPTDHIKEWDCGDLAREMRAAGLEIRDSIGVFCNLNKLEKIAQRNRQIGVIYGILKPKMDADFLSICMARFIGSAAQNILYLCDC